MCSQDNKLNLHQFWYPYLDHRQNARRSKLLSLKSTPPTVVDKADFGPVFGVQVTPDETGMYLHIRKADIILVGKSGLSFCGFL